MDLHITFSTNRLKHSWRLQVSEIIINVGTCKMHHFFWESIIDKNGPRETELI